MRCVLLVALSLAVGSVDADPYCDHAGLSLEACLNKHGRETDACQTALTAESEACGGDNALGETLGRRRRKRRTTSNPTTAPTTSNPTTAPTSNPTTAPTTSTPTTAPTTAEDEVSKARQATEMGSFMDDAPQISDELEALLENKPSASGGGGQIAAQSECQEEIAANCHCLTRPGTDDPLTWAEKCAITACASRTECEYCHHNPKAHMVKIYQKNHYQGQVEGGVGQFKKDTSCWKCLPKTPLRMRHKYGIGKMPCRKPSKLDGSEKGDSTYPDACTKCYTECGHRWVPNSRSKKVNGSWKGAVGECHSECFPFAPAPVGRNELLS